jgi:hypothetical protein
MNWLPIATKYKGKLNFLDMERVEVIIIIIKRRVPSGTALEGG